MPRRWRLLRRWISPSCPNYCHDSQTLVQVHDECTASGDWIIAVELVQCPQGEGCVIQHDHTAACVPEYCQERGVNYAAGTLLPVPDANYCLNSQALVLTHDVCTPSGDWDVADQQVQCPTGQGCVVGGDHTETCVPIQCEDSGVLYDAGDVLPVPEANYCHDSLTLALVQDVCTSSGDWDIQDQLVACAAGDHCVIRADDTAGCVPVDRDP